MFSTSISISRVILSPKVSALVVLKWTLMVKIVEPIRFTIVDDAGSLLGNVTVVFVFFCIEQLPYMIFVCQDFGG